jgi:hypothetical protein
VPRAARAAGIAKPIESHTLRHCFATLPPSAEAKNDGQLMDIGWTSPLTPADALFRPVLLILA